MKLKDILKTDTDNKGWLRVFKKLGADAEMLKYVNENISKSGGGSGGNIIDNEVLNEPLYYKLEWKEDISEDEKKNILFLIISITPKNSYIVLEGGYKDMPQVEIPINSVIAREGGNNIKLKITNKYSTGADEDEYGVYWYKIDFIVFSSMLFPIINDAGLNIIQISKEDYYSDIEVKYEDIIIKEQ